MKTLKYIAVLSITLFGFWNRSNAGTGDSPSVAGSYTVTVSDTTGPTSETISSDTIQPEIVPGMVVISNDTGITDPPQPKVNTNGSTSGEVNEDNPLTDLYDDFDTTIVHAEKFDALTFDDTVKIPLYDGRHCDYTPPFNGNLTSTFGFRSYRYHMGVDINLETGDTVLCAFDGKVRIAQKSKTYGYVVVVRHANGLETYYAHLSKLLVKPNQELEAGQVLGLGGNTGHSHGSHLHFEVRFRGQPIDPNYLIDFKNGTIRTDTYCLTKSDFKYLTKVYKVRHYSKKKKKTWYTYYNAGGAHYATPEAKRIMAAVPDPVMPGTKGCSSDVSNEANTNAAPQKSVPVKKPATTTSAPPKKPATSSSGSTQVRTPIAGATYYTIKSGDTLYGLALKYHTTVAKLCALNNISANSVLHVGQKVRIK